MINLDYFTIVESLLSPDKRSAKTVALNSGLVTEVANNHSLIFKTYKNGDTIGLYPKWTQKSYNFRDIVRHGNSIFQSTEDSNTTQPTLSDSWRLITDNFLGNDFRLKIRGEKIVLEYALNTWFYTTFRQPSQLSDIYITTSKSINIEVLRVGALDTYSSKIYSDKSSELVINSYAFTNKENMTINIPVAVFNGLAVSDSIREAVVRDFADKYVNAGLTYKILTY